MLDIHLATFTTASRKPTLARLLEAAHLSHAVEKRSATGKPYLEGQDAMPHGLSISHLRKATPAFSVMAVANEPQIGVDMEFWPSESDTDFLASIAANEDSTLIKRIAALGRDPATFLWVAKEAALKASGEVMLDPRNISVELSPNGHLCAATSARASAPVAQAHIRIWRFEVRDSNSVSLLALAVIAEPRQKAGDDGQWGVTCADLDLAPVF
jgi:phosphopantetheinyl transferase